MARRPTLALVLVSLLALAPLGHAPAASAQEDATEIDSCTTITEPGRYVLTADIRNATTDVCLEVRASDVVVDGGGHVVDGDESPENLRGRVDQFVRGGTSPFDPRWRDIGVAVTGSQTVANVTLRNLAVTDWLWGVVSVEARGGTVADSSVSNTGFGVSLFGTRNTAIRDVDVSENALVGLQLSGARGATVTNASATGNELAGVLVDSSDGVTVARSHAANNSLAGVYVFRSQDTAVTANVVRENRIGVYDFRSSGTEVRETSATANEFGVLLDNSNGATVANDTADGNEQVGIYLFHSNDSAVTGSTANSNGFAGIYLRNASGNEVTDNTALSNAFDGIYLENSTSNTVVGNDDGTMLVEATDDELGEEGGYAYDDDVEVDQSDGLSEDELRAYVYRAIARAEFIRELEFEEDISVEIISREEHRNRTTIRGGESGPLSTWRNQVWEALFVVDEATNASDEFDRLQGEGVAGYYSSFADKLVIISNDAEQSVVEAETLVHELTHALQNQHFDLTRTDLRGRTENAQRAYNGLVEGDATYVEEQFVRRCGVVWDCVQAPSQSPRVGEVGEVNAGIVRVFVQPYSDGPGYVDRLVRAGGWEAVDERYDSPPNATERILHPERDDGVEPIEVADRARNGWTRFDSAELGRFESENGTTTVGEAAIYAMFWYQGVRYDNPIFDPESHFVPNGGAFDRLNYTSAPSDGWANDLLVPYRNGDQFGYVWVTRWDTERDAREFHEAYLQVLRGHGAEERGVRTWVVPDGGFADAFRVVRDGRTVTVVNAPTVGDLDDVHPAAVGNVTSAR